MRLSAQSTGNDKEVQTVKFSPVYSADEDSENRKFWDATPTGKLELGFIKKEQGDLFDIGEEYYIEIIPVAE